MVFQLKKKYVYNELETICTLYHIRGTIKAYCLLNSFQSPFSKSSSNKHHLVRISTKQAQKKFLLWQFMCKFKCLWNDLWLKDTPGKPQWLKHTSLVLRRYQFYSSESTLGLQQTRLKNKIKKILCWFSQNSIRLMLY